MKNRGIKKVLKIITYIVVILFISIVFGGTIYYKHWRSSNTINSFTEFNEPEHIDYNDIYWRNDSLGKTLVEKTAFFLKVKIDEIEGDFYMQFDTGTPKTIFYGKTLSKVLKTNSVKQIIFTKDSTQFVKNVQIKIGKTIFSANSIQVKPNFGSNEIDTTFNVIGTIGFDAIVDRTLVLNFKSDKIAITKQTIDNLEFPITLITDASVDRFPLLIPAKIGEKKIRFFFDTGSSMFPILTSVEKLKDMKSESSIDTLCCVRNWNNLLPVYRRKINSKIDFNGIISENDNVYGINMSMMNILNYLPESFMFGMTDNKLFDNMILIVDNKNNKFGIAQ